MSGAAAASIGLEVSADRRRIVARVPGAHHAPESAPTAAVVGAPATYLVSLPGEASAGAGPPGGVTIDRAESAILTLIHASTLGSPGSRILARCPRLSYGAAVDSVLLAPAPGTMGVERALWVPLVADVMSLMDRTPLPPGASVACWGGGLTDELCAGLVGRRGGVMLGRPAVPGAAAARAARPHACLLIGADARAIEAAVALVADRGVILLLDPRAPGCRFDFYPDVHRRGLSLVHSAPGCGGVSHESLGFLRDEATNLPRLPVLTLRLGASGRDEVALELPRACPAILLQVEV